jgi:pimeloyl-ACP methyl ester carboxylesterase
MASTEAIDITLTCKDGIKLSGLRWTVKKEVDDAHPLKAIRIFCGHGWLDNCASFNQLCPGLIEKLCPVFDLVDIVALDFPGHGRSSHKSLDGTSMVLADFVYYVYDALQELGWENEHTCLIGHSMGGAIALMYAAAFRVSTLVMLDSLGPQTKASDGVSDGVHKHIRARIRGKPPSSIYPDLETAVETRCMTAKAFPGNQYISIVTARALVVRGSEILPNKKLQFLHDQRLKWPSILSFTQQQVEQFFKDVASHSTPTCILLAKDGMPFPIDQQSSVQTLLQPRVVFEVLPGSHHFHSDPASAKGVVDAVSDFLLSI